MFTIFGKIAGFGNHSAASTGNSWVSKPATFLFLIPNSWQLHFIRWRTFAVPRTVVRQEAVNAKVDGVNPKNWHSVANLLGPPQLVLLRTFTSP